MDVFYPPHPPTYTIHVRWQQKSQRLYGCRNTCHQKHGLEMFGAFKGMNKARFGEGVAWELLYMIFILSLSVSTCFYCVCMTNLMFVAHPECQASGTSSRLRSITSLQKREPTYLAAFGCQWSPQGVGKSTVKATSHASHESRGLKFLCVSKVGITQGKGNKKICLGSESVAQSPSPTPPRLPESLCCPPRHAMPWRYPLGSW